MCSRPRLPFLLTRHVSFVAVFAPYVVSCRVVSCQMRAETLTLLHAMSTEPDSLRAMGMKEGLEGLQMVRDPLPHTPHKQQHRALHTLCVAHTVRCTHCALHTLRVAHTARCTHRVHPRRVLLTLATLEQHRLQATPRAYSTQNRRQRCIQTAQHNSTHEDGTYAIT
jgi:hypothetical protein